MGWVRVPEDVNNDDDPILRHLVDLFANRVRDEIKLLLESKHLYQSVQLEYQDLVDAEAKSTQLSSEAGPTMAKRLRALFPQYVETKWYPIDPSSSRRLPFTDIPLSVKFQTPDVKLFCERCDRVEAFNVVLVEDFLARDAFDNSYEAREDNVQVFVVSFRCQSCKLEPEVFLIRRKGLKLTLSGRAPIEHVEVPPIIPKNIQRFFSGAIVAHQSGQTLAGLFMLRTLIEQWVQQKVQNGTLKADESIDQYMLSLPEDFRVRFKSIRELYGILSSDIHAAKGSPELFGSAIIAIIEHFEARRLYNLR